MKASAELRRASLLRWMRSERGDEWTASEIVDVIGYPYDELSHYRESRCFGDLVALERDGLVYRVYLTRPARWGLS
jgi:hypothetical protein